MECHELVSQEEKPSWGQSFSEDIGTLIISRDESSNKIPALIKLAQYLLSDEVIVNYEVFGLGVENWIRCLWSINREVSTNEPANPRSRNGMCQAMKPCMWGLFKAIECLT